ncbi:hypothetical protein CERZMDRAFT_94657 [Cercospora zeae-maydis SCOH1-5]|uniref:Transcription factor Iwr1 domain-containing protein n=1 Tax=Cercospora zeae-maydis SCOH1-5 TaxID=717836 RepID=A0A6A6FP97_9PEZI|nr:hypothetical protein CERZMDRAFT_94657 [Cercospora zeae-maydis SCOH1-5]
MSTGPQFIAIKRKRGEEAPAALLVERAGKRRVTEPGFHYVLKESGEDAGAAVVESKEAKENEQDSSTITPPSLFNADDVQRRAGESIGHQRGKLSRNMSGNGISQGTITKERRTFHLKRVGTPEPKIGKRKGKTGRERGIATFLEKRAKRDMNRSDSKAVAEFAGRQRSASVLSTQGPSAEPLDRPLKRPGKGAAIKTNGNAASSSSNAGGKTDAEMQSMADTLHQFAVHEASRANGAVTSPAPAKPKVTAMPKLSAQRSRAIHQQRVAQSSAPLSRSPQTDDASMDEEGDYVYDTYVLATTSGAAQIDAHDVGNVGYLIITEEDQAQWETYMDDDLSEEEPSDEDDENAEDWYGADYPDDEVASDDEFDRNAYGYRAGGSDNEEYEEHTFSEDEYERQLNPWLKKTPQQFAKYFKEADRHEEGED